MIEKIISILKDNPYTVPKLLFANYKKIDINEKELVLLILLLNNVNNIFNTKQISEDLGWNTREILEAIGSLSEKDLVKIEVNKINHSEYIILDGLYSKLSFTIINDDTKDTKDTNLYSTFEKEFGRTLSPMEYEIINAWINNDFSEELILLALKEATYNGVSNLRYIDKIIHEWKKKGIKNKDDIEKAKTTFRKKDIDAKLFEYDWLNNDK